MLLHSATPILSWAADNWCSIFIRFFYSSMTNCCNWETVDSTSFIFASYVDIIVDAYWATDWACTANWVASTACYWVASTFACMHCDNCSIACSCASFEMRSWSNILCACSWILNPISATYCLISIVVACCTTCNSFVSFRAYLLIFCILSAVALDCSCTIDCSTTRTSNSLTTEAICWTLVKIGPFYPWGKIGVKRERKY